MSEREYRQPSAIVPPMDGCNGQSERQRSAWNVGYIPPTSVWHPANQTSSTLWRCPISLFRRLERSDAKALELMEGSFPLAADLYRAASDSLRTVILHDVNFGRDSRTPGSSPREGSGTAVFACSRTTVFARLACSGSFFAASSSGLIRWNTLGWNLARC